MGPVRRVAFEAEEIDYIDKLQSSISTALKDGHCVTQPEPGLYYVVFAEGAPPVAEVMNSLSFVSPWIFSVNMMKNQQAWSPYFPFTLSIKERDHLWAFIRGDVFILVILDFEQLTHIARNSGVSAQLDLKDEDYPLQIEMPGAEGAMKISSHLLTRIGLEFVSPNWLIQSSIETLKRQAAEAKVEGGG